MNALTIYQQLGGGKFQAMTGAKNFVYTTPPVVSLRFRIPKAKNGINSVKITLNSMDTYDVEFGKVRAGAYTVISTHEGYYNDMLQSLFTAQTGLDTHL